MTFAVASILEWISWLFVMGCVATYGNAWLRTSKLFHGVSLGLALRMLVLSVRTPQAIRVGLSGLSVAGLSGLLANDCLDSCPTVPFSQLAFLLVLAARPLIYAAMPPAILFLTTSDPRTVRAFQRFMLEPSRAARTLWLVGPGRDGPALTARRIDPSVHALRTATEETLSEKAAEMLRERQALRATVHDRLHRDVAAIIADTYDNLPSVLGYFVVNVFDSREAIRAFEASGKAVLEIVMPRAAITKEVAREIVSLSLDFSIDSRLVLLVINRGDAFLVRGTFLLDAAPLLRHHVGSSPAPRVMTLEELDAPYSPPAEERAVHTFLAELLAVAAQRGLTSRYVSVHRNLRPTS